MILKADWLSDPFLKTLADCLGADNLRFVGGAVRDTLLDRPVADIDAASPLLPEDVMTRLKAANIRVVPTGLKHGTVSAVGDERTVEITTLRRDVETDGRHADVEFTDDWIEDAKRRDFTMNALYADIDGNIHDPLGGLEDAKAGHVRFIGNAAERIREDALRILRFFRFHAVLGKLEFDEDGLVACTVEKELLKGLSAERVRDELMKIFKCANPTLVIAAMKDAGIWDVLGLPVSVEHLESIATNEAKLGTQARPSVRLFLSLHPKLSVNDYCSALKMPGVIKKLLIGMGEGSITPETPEDVRQIMYMAGAEAAQQRALTEGWQEPLYDITTSWIVPMLPVQGRDIMATGVLPGPEVGERLKKLEAAWVASDFSLGRQALLDQI